MNNIMVRQTAVVSILVALLCLALLLGVLLILSSFTGAPHSQTGIMIIAPPYRVA
jgi:hypothetical protein